MLSHCCCVSGEKHNHKGPQTRGRINGGKARDSVIQCFIRYIDYSMRYNIQTWQMCFGRRCADGRLVVEYVSVVLVGRSGSVVLCTAGLEDMAVALSPGKCGSYRQILSNNSVSRWLRCRVNQTREIGPTRLSNALTSCSTSLILGTSTTICKTSKCGRGQPITLHL